MSFPTSNFASQGVQNTQSQPQTPAKVGLSEYQSGDRAASVNAMLSSMSTSAGLDRDLGAPVMDSLKGESGLFAFAVGDKVQEMKNNDGKVVSLWYPVDLQKEDGTLCRTSTNTVRRSLKKIIPPSARRSTGDMVAFLEGIQNSYLLQISECKEDSNGRTIFSGSFVERS